MILKSFLGGALAIALSASTALAQDPLTDFQKALARNPHAKAPDVCQSLRSRIKVAPEMFSLATVDQPPKGDTYGCVLGLEALPRFASSIIGKAMNKIWKGKKFNAEGTALVNKIPILGPIGLAETATAEVYRTQSHVDGGDIYVLDYTRSERNLPIEELAIRVIRDEVREISPGIFMGPVLVQIVGMPFETTLYFAVFTEKSGLLR